MHLHQKGRITSINRAASFPFDQIDQEIGKKESPSFLPRLPPPSAWMPFLTSAEMARKVRHHDVRLETQVTRLPGDCKAREEGAGILCRRGILVCVFVSKSRCLSVKSHTNIFFWPNIFFFSMLSILYVYCGETVRQLPNRVSNHAERIAASRSDRRLHGERKREFPAASLVTALRCEPLIAKDSLSSFFSCFRQDLEKLFFFRQIFFFNCSLLHNGAYKNIYGHHV